MKIPDNERNNTKQVSIEISWSISCSIYDIPSSLPIVRDPRGSYIKQYHHKWISQKARPSTPIPPPIPNKILTYSVETINAILLPVRQVPKQPNFCTLWKLSSEIQEFLVRLEHPDHPYEWYAGYMMTQASYVLYSTIRWQDPSDVCNYFIVPTTAITDTD